MVLTILYSTQAGCLVTREKVVMDCDIVFVCVVSSEECIVYDSMQSSRTRASVEGMERAGKHEISTN